MNKNYKLILSGLVVISISAASYCISQNREASQMLHTNVFSMGEELMEAMASCPFEEKEKCQIFVEECRFTIDSGHKEISAESIAECKFNVETRYEETCEGEICTQ